MNPTEAPFRLVISIPCYNEEANIGKLLRSLISQDHRTFDLQKIYVVSDGSTDQTVHTVTNVGDSRIQCIVHSERKGKSVRNNEVLQQVEGYDGILFLEGDTLPTDTNYLSRLITEAQKGPFSVIVGNSIPTPSDNFFSRSMNIGYTFRRHLFEHATNGINLYLCNGQSGLLLSKQFSETFRWDAEYHDDSYCYRKALVSSLPIRRAKEATIYFSSVKTIRDYFMQSGKFHKAKEKETQHTSIYAPTVSWFGAGKIFMQHLISSPLHMISYFILMAMSFFVAKLLPAYNSKWITYHSSKTVEVKN